MKRWRIEFRLPSWSAGPWPEWEYLATVRTRLGVWWVVYRYRLQAKDWEWRIRRV